MKNCLLFSSFIILYLFFASAAHAQDTLMADKPINSVLSVSKSKSPNDPQDTLKTIAQDTVRKRDSLVTYGAARVKNTKKSYFDKVITEKGDTVLGRIRFDKKANEFYFTNDDLSKDSIVSTKNTTGFSIAATDSTDAQEFQMIINDFYRLETGKGEAVTCYATQTYKTQKIKGESVQILQKRYCLVKNGAPYFINSANAKKALMTLLEECPLVVDKVKSASDPESDAPAFVKEYNQCFVKR